MIKGFHKEGRIFLIAATIISLLILWLSHSLLGAHWLFWLLATTILVFLYLFFQFFRIPARRYNIDDKSIIAPCDGKVVVIEEVEENEYIQGKCRQISIFMSPLNVHINWYPANGTVDYYKYHPGKYLVAWHPKSSTDNERTSLGLKTAQGKVLVRQIAGAVARRIRCYSEVGATIEQSTEFGFIKFGSRVDIFIPLEAEVVTDLEEKTIGGVTVLAKW